MIINPNRKAIIIMHRYSVTVSKSILKRVKTPIQHKRNLSVAVAIGDEESEGVRVAGKGNIIRWREQEAGEDKIDHGEEATGVETYTKIRLRNGTNT